jgi:hypothetical protein
MKAPARNLSTRVATSWLAHRDQMEGAQVCHLGIDGPSSQEDTLANKGLEALYLLALA